jgi:Neurotransmitter-gated ion-channel transmembrane region
MLPAIFFVIISYTSFWVSKEAVPARVSLCIIGVLITINFNNNLLTILPETTEPVWLQNFTQTILIFTAFAIIEYAFVNYTSFNHNQMLTTVENNILDIMARLYFNFQKEFRKQKTRDTLHSAKDKMGALSHKRAILVDETVKVV